MGNLSGSSSDFSRDLSGFTTLIKNGGSLKLYDGVVNVNTDLLVKAMNADDIGIETIKKKLLRMKEKNPQFLEEIKRIYGLELDSFAVALGNAKLFKETFLLPNYKPNKILNDLNKELSELQELKDFGDNMSEEEYKESINKLNERKKKLSESKFELILTECRAASDTNFLFKSIINKIYDFGVLHSAISLDGTIIEWGRGPCGQDLVCPNLDIISFLFSFEIKAKEDDNFFAIIWQKLKDAASFVLNFFSGGAYGRWSLGKANDSKLDKIAEVCVMYNKHKYYNPVTNNCQHFVKMILKKIDSDFSFDGEFGKIIKDLETKGKAEFSFKGKIFNTRKELDNYVKSINFSSLSKNDKKLLMCYKNTFDIYLRSQKDEKDKEKFKSTKEDEYFWRDLIMKEKEILSK